MKVLSKGTRLKKTPLYDHLGNPINNEDAVEDGMTPGVQALIETRINSAVDDLREKNREDLKELVRENTRKWQYLTIISSLITIVTLFYAPEKIISWTGDLIDKN